MYNEPLGPSDPLFPFLPLGPQPVMWYRGGYADPNNPTNPSYPNNPPNAIPGTDYQPWKDRAVAQSRFDRYEIYSPLTRHWAAALDLEQITFSFQDRTPKPKPDARLMLVAGDNDNYQPNAIYNSTIEVARALRDTAHGKAEFWLDTGHSIHSERPHLFVKEILYFLDNPDAGNSPNGTVVSTPPKADYSLVDR
jgi:pimeloyl-ACP methyl ester carboxylesterase